MDKTQGWGKIMVGARLEKMVEAGWVRSWSRLITSGLREGDAWELTEGMVAHKASNTLARTLLKSECDSLLIVDSDADFEPDFLEKLRTHEAGYEYDALQAFHLRRGWPPEAIWFKRDESGILRNCVIFGETTEDVALVGTHCVMIRRAVFEGMLGGADPEDHDWFFYPRHDKSTEDAAFSFEALLAGYRLGATSHVKVNHLGHLAVGWDVYQEYLQTSGLAEGVNRFDELSELIGSFTGQTTEEMMAMMGKGKGMVKGAWEKAGPETPEQVRAFYGSPDNGYLYDLLAWNSSPMYVSMTRPLRTYHDRRVLVVGAGLGTEAAILADQNRVDVFELPGVLRDFCHSRLNGQVNYLDEPTLTEAVPGRRYDLIVAIDTIEHFHPDEFLPTMNTIGQALEAGGELYVHNSFHLGEDRPMDFDHQAAFDQWTEDNHIHQIGPYVWRKE